MQKNLWRWLIVLVLLGTMFFLPQATHAQGGDDYPEDVDPTDVYRIARRLYCDVCAGVPLSDCPSAQCQVWREEIAYLLSEGQNESEIRQHFADRYGEQVSGVPLDDRNRFLVYAIPAVLSLLVIVAIGWQVWRWQGKNQKAIQAARAAGTLDQYQRPVPDNVDPDLLKRVLSDLESLQQ